MENINKLIIIIVVILVLLLIYYLFLQNKKENLANEIDWLNMSRGLNMSNALGYRNAITTLRGMEDTGAMGIKVFN